MRQQFLAGIVERASLPAEAAGWQWRGPGWGFAFHGEVPGGRLFIWDSLLLLVRGVARLRGDTRPLEPELVAAEIRAHYLDTGTLPLDRLEGGFNLVLLDGLTERAIVYRNYAASGELFYQDTAPGLLLSSNLAELAYSGDPTTSRLEAVADYLLHGSGSGRSTLLVGCHRVLPGELLTWAAGRLQRRMTEPPARPTLQAGTTQINDCLGAILADAVSLHGRLANLLGEEAGYRLQAVYNDTARTELLPTTFSALLEGRDHWQPTERVMLASRELGTEHRLIPVERCLAEALPAAIATTGEPHLEGPAFLLGLLAPAVNRHGFRAALAPFGAPGETPAPQKSTWWQRGWDALAGWLGRTPPERETLDLAAEWLRPDLGEALVQEGRARSVPPLQRALDEAGRAITLFNVHGLDLVCPYLDSRLLELSLPVRPVVGLGGPVSDWVTGAGPLRPLVDRLSLPQFLAALPCPEIERRAPVVLGRLLALSLWQRLILERGRWVRPETRPVLVPQAA